MLKINAGKWIYISEYDNIQTLNEGIDSEITILSGQSSYCQNESTNLVSEITKLTKNRYEIDAEVI